VGKRYKDAVIGTVLAVLSCIYLALSFQIKRSNIDRVVGSRMFPQICGIVILGLSIWLIVSGIKNAARAGVEEAEPVLKSSYTRTVIVLGSYAAYIFLMDKLGFTLSSVLYLFSQMLVMGKWPASRKSIALYLFISVTASIAIYILFNKVFLLMLPKAGWL